MTEIVLEDLVKTYGGDIKASDHLSLTVRDGEYLCLLGPTGSGKTTALREICGLTVPDSGRVLFDGRDMSDVPISVRKATMLSQKYALFPNMDVYGNVVFSPVIKEWSEKDTRQLATSMIDMVHMSKKIHNMPGELSGGQQQRTALARALSSESKILLLDEPLRALDARLRIELRKELKSMVQEMGLTSIHVTHDQDEALEVADRIAIIRRGKIVQVGTPTEVFQNPATPFVANFLGRSNNFTGKLIASDTDRSVIEIAPGILISARSTDIPPGEDVVVTVKVGATVPEIVGAKVDVQDKHKPDVLPEGYF
ncbi:ABC-type spermidine/putrescine transport systems, ATPase component [Thermoplasmatales archaeon BRNA1]|nr:ABC-type spermidine/putrescine transport systems, ATPase component [Thermoplasmatales archaeon BRNA1]